MSHTDHDALALAALDERLDDAAIAHLADCAECRTELDALRRVVHGARYTDGPLQVVGPPPAVWARIMTEIGLAGTPGGAVVTPRREGVERRRPGRWASILAAAAGVVVGATAGGLLATQVGPTPERAPTTAAADTIATADLEPLTPVASPGRARVLRDDGARVLTLRLRPAQGAGDGAFREVWLLDAEQGQLVSLGVLEGSSGRFTLPADLRLGDYPTVDVSAEPFDGDPAHSGDSLVRGDLTF